MSKVELTINPGNPKLRFVLLLRLIWKEFREATSRERKKRNLRKSCRNGCLRRAKLRCQNSLPSTYSPGCRNNHRRKETRAGGVSHGTKMARRWGKVWRARELQVICSKFLGGWDGLARLRKPARGFALYRDLSLSPLPPPRFIISVVGSVSTEIYASTPFSTIDEFRNDVQKLDSNLLSSLVRCLVRPTLEEIDCAYYRTFIILAYFIYYIVYTNIILIDVHTVHSIILHEVQECIIMLYFIVFYMYICYIYILICV